MSAALPDALEGAASALPTHADPVRDANGDPELLLDGLDDGAAGEVLAWVLEHEPDAGGELASAWSESEEGAAVLLALDESALAKPGRKALRRALHRLRARGVAVDDAAAKKTVVSRLPQIDDSIEGALITPLDPRGSRLAYLLEAHPAGGARLFEMALDDVRGIVEFRVYSTGRSRARAFLKDLALRGQVAPLAVETAQVRALLARAAAVQASDRPAPRAFVEHRSQLALDTDAATPGELVAAELGPVAPEASALEPAVAMVKSGVLGPWPPDLEALRALGERVREQLGGKLIVSGATQHERQEEVLSAAAAEIYDESFGAVTATRLRESAFLMWKRDQIDEARACLAAAAAFESQPPAENRMARAFVDVLLAPLLEQLEQEEQQAGDTSLLVKP